MLPRLDQFYEILFWFFLKSLDKTKLAKKVDLVNPFHNLIDSYFIFLSFKMVLIIVSGLRDILSIPSLNRKAANSGKSLGA